MAADDATQQVRSRRAILGAAAAGAVALSAGRLIRPEEAAAATGTMMYGDDNDAGDLTTILRSTNALRTLEVHGSGAYAISGEGEGAESTGVVGIGSGPGTGVRGVSNDGVGLVGESTTGFGLKVDGKAGFSTAGAASVEKGRASVTVHMAGVTPVSLVIATIQRDRNDLYVRGVVVGTGSFRILLSRKVSAKTKVAYFVIEQVAPPRPGVCGGPPIAPLSPHGSSD
jgi:hypothetical protein